MSKQSDNGDVTKDSVMVALSKVQEPELHRDLVSLNMIRDLEISGGDVTFTVVLTTPACPLKHVMERDCREAVMQISGVQQVTINWDADVRGDSRIAGRLNLGVRNTIAIASGKGGVGKSTVATNLAVALIQTGARVGLLDADIYGPNCDIMLGATGKPQISINQKMIPLERYGVKIISMGMLVPEGQALIWRGPMLHSAIRQFIMDVEWGELDYLVIDLPPGTGDAQLTLSQALPLTGGVIVTLPQKVSQADARRGLETFRQLKVPIIGVVENMGVMTLPDGTKLDVFGAGGGETFAAAAGVPFIGSIPMDPQVRVSGDVGTPIVLLHPESAVTQALVQISKDIAARVSVLNFESRSNVIPLTVIN